MKQNNDFIINELYKLSYKAFKKNEVPVAAIIIQKNKIIAKAYNKRKKNNLVISHAEILAIIKAQKKIKDWRLDDCTLYVTLKPCEMCEKIIKESRIKEVHYILEKYDSNKEYNKTKYEQMYGKEKEFKNLLSSFFEKIRD